MARLILMLLGLVLLALVHPPLLLASLAAPRPPHPDILSDLHRTRDTLPRLPAVLGCDH
jgi:hypothetical protein